MNVREFLIHLRQMNIHVNLKGDRLYCNAPKGVITHDMRTALSNYKAEIIALLQQDTNLSNSNGSIVPVSHQGYLPLSYSQERLWLLAQIEQEVSAYNIPMVFRLKGQLDIKVLEESIQEIVRRHSVLRTTFHNIDGQLLQIISNDSGIKIQVHDYTKLPNEQRESEALRLVSDVVHKPFDLARGPLLHVCLIYIGQDHYILVLNVHHIVWDGWSFTIFFHELKELYHSFLNNKPSPLPKLPIQYVDFAVWQRKWLSGNISTRQIEYWKHQLGNRLPILELPIDHPRPAVQTHHGACQVLELSRDLTEGVKELGQTEHATLFMILLAAFNILLSKYSGQKDIVVGFPIAGRNRKEIQGLLGFFVNTLVLRTDLSDDTSFSTLLSRIRTRALDAYAHQDIPFERVIEELRPKRDLSRTPLFQVFFNMVNVNLERLELSGLMVEAVSLPTERTRFDLTLYAPERNRLLNLEFRYNAHLFDSSTVAFMLENLKNLLAEIVANPEKSISRLRLVDRRRPSQLHKRTDLLGSSHSYVAWLRDDISCSIPERFEQQVQEHPSNIAIETSEDEWTYDTLNKTANRAATRILKSCGSTEERIGLLFEHGAQMIAAILAVSKAGKVYVPLDPSLPTERINFILSDSQAATLLTNNTNLALAKSLKKGQLQVVNVDDIGPETPSYNINLPMLPEVVAYILYTSGSTGRPKGVVQTHRNVLYHIRNYTNGLHIDSGDRLTLFSNYSFDAAMMDIMGALLNGATLCPMDLKEKSSVRFSEWLNKEKITIYHSTPTVYRYLISTLTGEEEFPRIRLVVLGGEEVYKKDVDMYKQHFSPDCIFVNTYGPTESTIVLQYFVDQKTKISRNTVPLGYVVDDTEILLLDKKGEVTDVYGEIAIRSDYVAIGYWRKPESMDEVFLPDGGYRRLYRTGDIGRLLPDGSIQFKGRKDLQVKIRGFRVEPGEIESALCSNEAVKECVVATSDNGHRDNKLIAYVVCNESLSSLSLRRYLRDYLPDYMIPSEFIQLDSIPLIHNGKTDYAALSLLGDSHAMQRPDYVQPISPVEKKIAEIWQNVLDVDKISLPDNFFDLGGHSLMVVKAISLIGKELGIHVPFREFFNQTLRQFAASCEEKLLSNKHDYAKKQY